MSRKFICGLSFLVLSVSSSAQEMTIGSVDVDLDNEIQSLAKGYAAAFKTMPSGPKYVVVRTEDGEEFLEGSIREVEAIEGVLVISVERGPVTILSAKDVLRITNTRK